LLIKAQPILLAVNARHLSEEITSKQIDPPAGAPPALQLFNFPKPASKGHYSDDV
jgi:hypothetical protein